MWMPRTSSLPEDLSSVVAWLFDDHYKQCGIGPPCDMFSVCVDWEGSVQSTMLAHDMWHNLRLSPCFLACVMAIAQTALMWGQRRESLVIDFLRPVSRAGYWQGLRKAIALDLVFPAVLGAVCLGLAVGMSASGGPWTWGVAAILLVGIFVMTHAMVLLLAVTRWPLVVGTLMVVLLVAAVIGSAVAIGHVFATPADLWTALVVAGAVLAVGVGIQIGVLWRLEEREIG